MIQDFFNFIVEYISNNILLIVLGVLTFYQTIYLIIGVFAKKKTYKETDIKKKYAVVIAARNEEKVIGNLIDSLNRQTYDKDYYQVFVVADNCTDNTADVARAHGATVYERFDETKKRKGWALEYLFDKIDIDYCITSFDGYIVFDADNLVHENFIHEMNKAFVERGGIIVGYRNVKNFDTNFVSSGYGVHFYRSIVSLHRPRTKLNLGTHIAGTGWVIDSKLIENGWTFHSLTEDAEMTQHFSCKGYKIGFCEDAIFYDEQPTDLITSFRQRRRWVMGRLLVFFRYFPSLIFNGIRRFSFTIYDMFIHILPWPFYYLAKFIFIPIISGIIYSKIGTGKFWLDFLIIFLTSMGTIYLQNLFFGALVVIRERKNIPASTFKKIISAFTYPWFDMTTIFIALGVLFAPRVRWTRIVHDDERKIDDIKHD